jgi:endonuclease YncB( thermonuclease family)
VRLQLRRLRLPLLALAAAAALLLAAVRGGYRPGGTPAGPREESVDPRALAVVDGDTLLLDDRELRLLGADTPERGAPWFRGDQEPWASLAADRVRVELTRARRVTLLGHGERDAYGRELVHVLIDGRPLAEILVGARLAYPTVARFGHGGFPDLATQVVEAARAPAFEAPWRWRARQRREPPADGAAGDR